MQSNQHAVHAVIDWFGSFYEWAWSLCCWIIGFSLCCVWDNVSNKFVSSIVLCFKEEHWSRFTPFIMSYHEMLVATVYITKVFDLVVSKTLHLTIFHNIGLCPALRLHNICSQKCVRQSEWTLADRTFRLDCSSTPLEHLIMFVVS